MKTILFAELFLNVVKALLLIGSSVHLLQLTQSISLFGAAMLLEALSSVIAPMHIGRLIDKYGALSNYRNILLVVVGLSLMVLAGGAAFGQVAYIFGAYSVISFFSPLQRLAQQSYFAQCKQVVDLKVVNARHQMMVQGGQMMGLLLAMWWVDKYSFEFVHTVSIALLAVAAACVFGAKSVQVVQALDNQHTTPQANAPKQGIFALLSTLPKPLVVILVMSTFDYLIISVFNLSLAVIAQDFEAGHGRVMSYFDMAYASGSIAISYLIAKGVYLLPHHKNVLLSYAVMTFLFMGLLILPFFGLKMLLIVLIGVFTSLSVTAFNTYIQSQLPTASIGRVLAARRIILSVLLFVVINGLSWVHSFGEQIYNGTLIGLIALLSAMVVGYLAVNYKRV